jgi:hypothetical protein
MSEFTAIVLKAIEPAMKVFGQPVTVKKKDATEVTVQAVREWNVEIVGEYGQRVDIRDRLSFLINEVSVEIGDRVAIEGVEKEIDAIDTDDGVIRAVWVR